MVAPLATRLNRRITIQTRNAGQDTFGETLKGAGAWSSLVTLWAEKRDVSGREFYAASAAQSAATVKFIIRYRNDITAGMRLMMGAQLFNIEAALDPAGTRRELTLFCSAGIDGESN